MDPANPNIPADSHSAMHTYSAPNFNPDEQMTLFQLSLHLGKILSAYPPKNFTFNTLIKGDEIHLELFDNTNILFQVFHIQPIPWERLPSITLRIMDLVNMRQRFLLLPRESYHNVPDPENPITPLPEHTHYSN
jgi:hypothetical protein